jgi:hypothetical protein
MIIQFFYYLKGPDIVETIILPLQGERAGAFHQTQGVALG